MEEGLLLTVKIVTDSTASIPAEICRRLGITVVPVTIHFGTDTHLDGVDPAEAFYERLVASEQPPTTSTPSPGAFIDTYRRLAEEATAIISIHVMGTKSTLINVAHMAAQMLPELRIHVVDSRSTTLGLGLLTMAAAKAAQLGHPVQEILALLERLIPRVHTHAAIRQMTQLRRSGRVSLGQALLAGMLSIKPVLYLGQSVVEVVDKVRGWPGALDRIIELAQERVQGARVHLAIVHTNAEEEAQRVLAAVRERISHVEAIVTDAGTALASHAGPGAVGIVTMETDPLLGAEPIA
ncbi:MAG: DegV family protein [Bacillota bacterium]